MITQPSGASSDGFLCLSQAQLMSRRSDTRRFLLVLVVPGSHYLPAESKASTGGHFVSLNRRNEVSLENGIKRIFVVHLVAMPGHSVE
jgi:hypothetical protein